MSKQCMMIWLGLALMATNAVAQNTFPASGNVGFGTTILRAT